jgi:hypothetical protein
MDEHRHPGSDRIEQPVPEAQPTGLLYISDVQALQCADRVSFHCHEAQGCIHADLTTWPLTEPRIYTPKQQRLFPDPDGVDRRRRIEVDTSIVGFDHTRRWHERALPGAGAFHSIHAARLDEVWRSIVAFLRVGDVITLHWRADNTTDPVAAAGLHRDELRIGVQRGQRRWQFLVDISVSTADARMVTRPAAA